MKKPHNRIRYGACLRENWKILQILVFSQLFCIFGKNMYGKNGDTISKVSSYIPTFCQEKCSNSFFFILPYIGSFAKEFYALKLISFRLCMMENYLLLVLVFFIV